MYLDWIRHWLHQLARIACWSRLSKVPGCYCLVLLVNAHKFSEFLEFLAGPGPDCRLPFGWKRCVASWIGKDDDGIPLSNSGCIQSLSPRLDPRNIPLLPHILHYFQLIHRSFHLFHHILKIILEKLKLKWSKFPLSLLACLPRNRSIFNLPRFKRIVLIVKIVNAFGFDYRNAFGLDCRNVFGLDCSNAFVLDSHFIFISIQLNNYSIFLFKPH